MKEKKRSIKKEAVNSPDHYSGAGFECIDFIASARCDFFTGNIIKYLWRYKKKGGDEDLRKALWYASRHGRQKSVGLSEVLSFLCQDSSDEEREIVERIFSILYQNDSFGSGSREVAEGIEKLININAENKK